MRLEGGCYCGAIRYVAEGEPMLKAQCYCRECQFMTGGAPNNFIAMPVERFRYTSGSVAKFARGDLDKPVTREFCPTCGTHVATRPPAWPAVVIKVGTLDDPSAFSPDMAIFAIDRQPYHAIADNIPVHERMPAS